MTVFSRTLIYVTLLAIAVVQAFPLVWMLPTWVKNQREVFGTFLPRSIDLSNFARAWTTIDLPRHLLKSLHVTALTVVIVVVVSTLAGCVFARFCGRDAIFYVFIAAMMIPGQAILIPMFQFLKAIGLLDTLTGLALSCLGGSVAFSIFLMRAFFVSLPHELGDAAKMDGAGEWGAFWHVVSPENKAVQSALLQAVGRHATDHTALSSGLIMALVPIFAVFLVLQRQIIQGLTAGAVKG